MLSHKSNRRLPDFRREQIKFQRAVKNQKIASDFLIFYRSERIFFGGFIISHAAVSCGK
jgi:cell wall-associated NlpC family hydrolase